MDLKSFGTVAGASAATILIVNTIQSATGWNERWFPLAVAIAICTIGRFAAKAVGTNAIQKIMNGAMMGFIVFSTAFAGQNALISQAPVRGTVLEERVETTEVPMPMEAPPAFETRTRLVPRRVILPPETRTFRSKW